MHSGGKYVVIIVFRAAICQLSPSRYLLDPHSSCWVGGWDALCECVWVRTVCVRVVNPCMQYTKRCIWCVHRIQCPGPSSILIPHCPILLLSLTLSLSYVFMVYIPSTDTVCLFELFTFFRDAVIHWIYKYNSVCLCVVCMLDSKHSPCNDVQRIRCISCVCLQIAGGECFSLEKQNPFCIFGFVKFPAVLSRKTNRKIC